MFGVVVYLSTGCLMAWFWGLQMNSLLTVAMIGLWPLVLLLKAVGCLFLWVLFLWVLVPFLALMVIVTVCRLAVGPVKRWTVA